MPRGHESTWPYTGRYTPSPPLAQEGPPSSPGQGAPPPPPPQGTAALGSPRPAPGGLSGFAPEPARPFSPPLTSRSPEARNHQGPGPRSPGAQPRPPARYPSGGARPRLHQDSPPWMMLGGMRPRRAGRGPHR